MPGLTEGTIAGLVAGVVMSLWKMVQGLIDGSGFWRPPNLIATIHLGERANRREFVLVPFCIGMALHLLTFAFMGWFYALVVSPLFRHPTGWGLVVASVVYALFSWGVYQYLIMPWLAPIMNRHVNPFWLAVAHVVYALAFAGWILLAG